jgi:hypothetical protein
VAKEIVVDISDGDLALIRDGKGFIVGVFSGSPNIAIFGDVKRVVSHAQGDHVLPRSCVTPGAGALIGKRFGSKLQLHLALKPFYTPEYFRRWAAVAGKGAA